MSAKTLSAIVIVALVIIALIASRFTGSSSASTAQTTTAKTATSQAANAGTSSTQTGDATKSVSKTQLKHMVDQAKQVYDKVYASYQGTPSAAADSQFMQLEGQEARAMTQLGMSLPDTSKISSMAERALVIDTNSVIASAQTCMSDMAGVLDGNVTQAQLKNDIQFYQQQYSKALKALG